LADTEQLKGNFEGQNKGQNKELKKRQKKAPWHNTRGPDFQRHV
jgi:hypothetical protein